MVRTPNNSHAVDQDFDDVTVADLVNANPVLAYYLNREKADQRHEDTVTASILRSLRG